MIQVSVDKRDIENLKKQMRSLPSKVPVAISRAINDASRSAVTIMDREIRGRYNVRSSDVRPAIRRKGSTPQTLESRLDVKSLKFPLFKFGITARRSDLVTIEEVKGKRTPLQHFFIAIMDSGHVGIFRRTGQKRRMTKGAYMGKVREGIAEVFGLAVPQMMESRNVVPKIIEKSNEVFRTRLVHHADYLMKQVREEMKNAVHD